MAETTNNTKAYTKIGIVGAGAWGTALGTVAAQAGREVVIWARESDVIDSINTHHENVRFLPGVSLRKQVRATPILGDALACEAVLITTPAQHLRVALQSLAREGRAMPPSVLCAKGIEKGSGKLVTEIFSDVFPDARAGILSGPSFAADVARGQPTAVTIAGEPSIVRRLQAALASPSFRPYASNDVLGVALGGAAKNVYAIACGIVDGLGLGESARAALIARSFAELTRLGEALGARADTLMGLSGLGDLVLTATSSTSRNFAFGEKLGRGSALSTLKSPGQPLAEGVDTAPALVERGRAAGVELPVAAAVDAILSGALEIREAVSRLMSRPLTSE